MRMNRSIGILLLFALAVLSGCDGGGGGASGNIPPGTPAALQISTISLVQATVGVPYSAVIDANGGVAPYSWSVTGGALPSGVAISGGTPSATVLGTPSVSGTFNFTVQVQDAAQATAIAALTIVVAPAPAPALNIVTTTLPGGTSGLAYSANCTATGGTGSYSWSVLQGALPNGLALSSGTPSATLAGTPSLAGTFNFTLQVTDAALVTDTQTFSVVIAAAAPPLQFTTTSLPNGVVAVPYSQSITASGGSGSYTFSLTAGALPNGLLLTSGTPSATLAGTPTLAGSFNFTLQVQDAALTTLTQAFSVTIAASGSAPVLTTVALENGLLGATYYSGMGINGGTAPFSLSLSAGALPPGLNLSGTGSSALISGTCAGPAGIYHFAVTVSDLAGLSDTGIYSIEVVAGGPMYFRTPRKLSALPGNYQIRAATGTVPFQWTALSLPTGWTLSASTGNTATLTTTGSGGALCQLQVTDGALNSATQYFYMPGAASVLTGPLPGATVGEIYSQELPSPGTTPPYTWSVASGALPPGLYLHPGYQGLFPRIEGVPAATGSSTFTLQAAYAGGTFVSNAYTLEVFSAVTFFGETIGNSAVFLLDCSGSMYGSRMASLRAELTSTLLQVAATTEIDCVAYGDQFGAPTYTKSMWGQLRPCTAANRCEAEQWVAGPALNPGGGTPTYPALKHVCQTYPTTLETMCLVTDGTPSGGGSSSQILADFPGWWAPFTNTKFIGVCIGGMGSAATFMQTLTALANGVYVQR